MKKRRVKGVEAPSKPARYSSTSDKEDAQAQGTHVAAAEAREDAKKARVRGEGVAGGDCAAAAAAAAEEKMEGWEEWPWWTREVAVEEAMSFESVWSPFWDGEFMGDEAYNVLFGDVPWDDGDLWNLKDLEKPKA
ncbi:hypothetical protein ACJRO7_028361 [Eucalyptus globulus]|uniref:Uncharacterized protein n=1 Tax=Eucalyptus globulus TaxID=34317 RepID=A0ABD3JYX7_EUCGL